MTNSPFQRSATYVGRDEQIQTIVATLKQILDQPVDQAACYARILEADGGIGKTRLMQVLHDLVQRYLPDSVQQVRIGHIIDFDEYTSRSPRTIEQRLIDGLLKEKSDHDQWYRCSTEELDAAFEKYNSKRRTFEMQYDRRDADKQRIAEEDLITAFVDGWNTLAAKYLLIMQFDTIERLFRLKPLNDALINQPEASSGAELVIQWLKSVLPRLRRTFVLLSGRPLRQHEEAKLNKRIEEQVQPLLDATNLRGEKLMLELIFLSPFPKESPDIEAYINAYIEQRKASDEEVSVRPATLDEAFALTQGYPLFLSIYAETLLPPFPPEPRFPASPKPLANKAAFEAYIIRAVLNTLAIDENATKTLMQSLYILEYARRGLTREQLIEAFAAVGYTCEQTAFEQFQEIALIKTRGNTFLLHDEIARLIDEGKFVSDQGIDTLLLGHLIEQSRKQVEAARDPSKRTDAVALLQAMANHVYYTLQGSVRAGYRLYLIYMDLLLGTEQRVDDALVLSDAFWEGVLLFAGRAKQEVNAYLDSEHGLSYDEVVRDEQVRRVKLLMARSELQQAVALGTKLIDRYKDELDSDPYFAADLLLTTASADIKANPFGSTERIDNVLARLDESRLAAIDKDKLIHKRRDYFIGLTHNILSNLAYQQSDYDTGIERDKLARIAFEHYRTHAAQISDDVTSLIAQVNNNYAYHLLQTGNLTKARQVSQRLIDEYGQRLPPYRAALVYNSGGLILRATGQLDRAEAAIDRAMEFAETSGSRRALGLVHMARAQVRRERSVQRGEVAPQIEDDFATAATYLRDEPDQLREVYFQWSGFTRELAVAARKQGDEQQAESYQKQTLEYLDIALALAGKNTMQTAEFLKSKAIIYNLMGEYAAAEPLLDETEAILTELKAPKYVQVICGKVAFQRGVIAFRRDKQYNDALVQFVIGLARQYLYAAQHRDQADFEQRIEAYIREMQKEDLQAAQLTLPNAVEQVQIGTGALAYQPPEDNDEWRVTLRKSTQYVLDTMETQLEV